MLLFWTLFLAGLILVSLSAVLWKRGRDLAALTSLLGWMAAGYIIVSVLIQWGTLWTLQGAAGVIGYAAVSLLIAWSVRRAFDPSPRIPPSTARDDVRTVGDVRRFLEEESDAPLREVVPAERLDPYKGKVVALREQAAADFQHVPMGKKIRDDERVGRKTAELLREAQFIRGNLLQRYSPVNRAS